jgi:crotonobetainyl-CoA:carnitine CoA-transferase CaiB-like acyl-CoA transferase
MIFAGLGAEVIKIERPGSGDDARAMAPSGAYFLAINRGKKSVAIDLSRPEGITLALRLAARCDVFIENFRGGKAEAMGLGESAVRAAQPRIVYASLSAFGPHGADFSKPGYDALVQARTGIQSVTGEPGTSGARAGISVLDMGSGMWVALGVIAALFERQKNGAGSRVDGSLFETGVMWMAYHLVARQMTGRDPAPQGTRHSAFAPYGDYATADSRVLIGISNDRLFARLCEAVGFTPDARFAANAGRVENRDALDAALAPLLRNQTTQEWLEKFESAGVPASAVQTTGQLLHDPQLEALAQMTETAGLKSPVVPIEFNGSRCNAGDVPRLGEHTREVFLQCGLSGHDVDALIERKIVECLPSQKSSS